MGLLRRIYAIVVAAVVNVIIIVVWIDIGNVFVDRCSWALALLLFSRDSCRAYARFS
jgi:hypothetical protein